MAIRGLISHLHLNVPDPSASIRCCGLVLERLTDPQGRTGDLFDG